MICFDDDDFFEDSQEGLDENEPSIEDSGVPVRNIFPKKPPDFSASENFDLEKFRENLGKGTTGPWKDLADFQSESFQRWPNSKKAFHVEDCHQSFAKWTGSVPLPKIFASERSSKPRLTNAENGLFRQLIDLNLSEIASFLVEKYQFAAVGKKLAIFRGPDWEILSSDDYQREVFSYIAKASPEFSGFLNSRHLDEIVRHILRDPKTPQLREIPAADPHTLCCSDQLYVWPEGRRFEASSRDLRFSHLEVASTEIGPVPTPYFDDFLRTVTGDDENLCSLILEVIGVILAGYPCKNFFVFEGVPSSGKSQLARFLRGILGKTSCYSVNGVNELAGRWTTGMLPGKLLCLCSDVPDKSLSANVVGLIKQLTGDDPIQGEKKYENPFVFENMAKLLFLSNFPLRIAGGRQDAAILQRLVRVPFRHSVPQGQQIPKLYEHLLDEAGGIIWQALQALADMEERGGGFTEIEADQGEFVSLIQTEEDRVRAFVRDACYLEPGARTPVQELYTAFLDFESSRRRDAAISAALFGKILSRLGLPVKPYRTAETRGYEGICLRENI